MVKDTTGHWKATSVEQALPKPTTITNQNDYNKLKTEGLVD